MAKLETCGGKGLAQQGSKDARLEELEDFLRENAERRLCMAAVDVEHFKLDEAGCNWEQYSPSMQEKLKQRQQLLIEIERALQNEEFCFYLQPKCNSMTHAIVGMEALVRWNHPTRGIVSPGEFVPLMEETGLITRLDLYLWEAVCQMLHGWKARNENMVPISVNVSIADIAALDVAQVLWELVQKYQLEPKLLLVEITESMLAQNLKMVENTIAALHRKGFAVLMDDFGSGYSSLNVLRNTSVDAIKLDMQFIVRDSESSKGKQIVESVIEMARRLNLPIIAEGVETQEQVFMLQSMDCLYTQGYYFYKPMAVKQAEELLAQPAMENYWDLRRDMTRRNYKAFTGGLVSEKSAITLQAFQILADNALLLARLDLVTGECRVVKRDERLMDVSEEKTLQLESYCEQLVAQKAIHPEDAAQFRAQAKLELLQAALFRELRKVSTVPILFLTAKSQESDKLLGLTAGGDDYLPKPFSFAELSARVKALLRRYCVYQGKGQVAAQPENLKLISNGVQLALDCNRVWVEEREVDLTETEYKILRMLMQNPERIFSVEMIYETVWGEPYYYTSNGTVMVHIRNLRTKIEADPQNPKRVCTVWGKGYRFVNEEQV